MVATELALGTQLLTGRPVYDTITTVAEIEGGTALLMQRLVEPSPSRRQWWAIAVALFPAREAIWERMRDDGSMYLMRAPIRSARLALG